MQLRGGIGKAPAPCSAEERRRVVGARKPVIAAQETGIERITGQPVAEQTWVGVKRDRLACLASQHIADNHRRAAAAGHYRKIVERERPVIDRAAEHAVCTHEHIHRRRYGGDAEELRQRKGDAIGLLREIRRDLDAAEADAARPLRHTGDGVSEDHAARRGRRVEFQCRIEPRAAHRKTRGRETRGGKARIVLKQGECQRRARGRRVARMGDIVRRRRHRVTQRCAARGRHNVLDNRWPQIDGGLRQPGRRQRQQKALPRHIFFGMDVAVLVEPPRARARDCQPGIGEIGIGDAKLSILLLHARDQLGVAAVDPDFQKQRLRACGGRGEQEYQHKRRPPAHDHRCTGMSASNAVPLRSSRAAICSEAALSDGTVHTCRAPGST